MKSRLASAVLVLSIAALGAAALSCGSVTSASDGGTAGASAGGTTGAAGTGSGAAGTSGAAGIGGGGMSGRGAGGLGGTGGAPLLCRTDVPADCPSGFTCACGGPGPVSAANCTCHRNCTDATLCPMGEPMCGCPGAPAGTPRFCVNACFCSCQ